MSTPQLPDYQWLTSGDARQYLDRVGAADANLVSLTKSLRRELSAARTHLILEQVELRRRANEKFPAAGQLFFTRRALEQSTGWNIAKYKSSRFVQNERTFDLCCGIGGDLLSLAARVPAQGFDRDPVCATLARRNCDVLGLDSARVEIHDVAQLSLDNAAAWHIDPDRRSSGRRATRIEQFAPDASAIDRLLEQCPHAAVKLAPASDVPEHWAAAERQWLGHDRQCPQQVAWFGKLADYAGRRTATIVAAHGSPNRTVVGSAVAPTEVAARIGRYVYEPHAAVLAARLTDSLAAEHGLPRVAARIAYLTGDHAIADPALAAFEVLETLPFDVKRLKAVLRSRRIRRVEVKQRGVKFDPREVQAALRTGGDGDATLLLYRSVQGVQAILAKRVASDSSSRIPIE